MKRIRLQVGVRLMLLLVTLFCVLCAWDSARRELRYHETRAELIALEDYREVVASSGFESNAERARLAKIDAEIAETRQRLGKPLTAKK